MFVPDTNSVSEARMTFVSEGTEYDEEIPNVTEETDEPPKMSFSIGVVESKSIVPALKSDANVFDAIEFPRAFTMTSPKEAEDESLIVPVSLEYVFAPTAIPPSVRV